MEKKYDIKELLEYIDPSILDYQQWIEVGMGLQEDGYPVSLWDDWSRRDARRYHAGECEKKWKSFRGAMSDNITAGTIVKMARDNGWRPPEGTALDWDAEIGSGASVVDKNWIEKQEIADPGDGWDPVSDLIKYLETLFEASENVGYVTEVWQKEDKYLPTKGVWDRTAGELIQALNKCHGDIGAVLGDYREAAGAWIRFNPLDGRGVKNENVTDYRYALVESDDMDLAAQNAIIRELELPVACLVFSGKKSIHAIVRIDAGSYEEYRRRVNYLYDICRQNGLKIDTQNRNPSRLSRMPGVIRNGRKQFLIDTNLGKESFEEWQEWIESVNDNLPDPENLTSVWDDLPELSPTLIDGILRQGHKMLLAGPSKAGKSYLLIELAIAIAEGRKWVNWNCAQGRIMYVNLELDRASCLHRFQDVYRSLGLRPEHIGNIDIWNLRGHSIPMDKLAPKLIRRAAKKDYIAIIIDPIYKIITGDENSADQMAHFCNQFDKVCTELGCAVIYCHHHSKGGQGQKRSMDRASGSGVFARDPDALLDLIELEVNDDLRKQKQNEMICEACIDVLDRYSDSWENHVSQDDMCSAYQMKKACNEHLVGEDSKKAEEAVRDAEKRAEALTAWRIEGTLREFPKFAPVNLWFNYPAHKIDDADMLKDVCPEGEVLPWKKGIIKNKKNTSKRKVDRRIALENAIENGNFGEQVTVDDVAKYLGKSTRSVRSMVKEHGDYIIKNNYILRDSE